ncbi:MAG: DUF5615 family PIN-like protein [Blastocatellales bacterium]
MKLLLDENLSDRILPGIADLYPGSTHVKTAGLMKTDDGVIWKFAETQDYIIVSKDSDFRYRSLLFGHPQKFIFLRVGNCPTSFIIRLLRDNYDLIKDIVYDPARSLLLLSA